MKARTLVALAVVFLTSVAFRPAQAFEGKLLARHRARNACCSQGPGGGGWQHAPYYHTMWGQPVALVVPPTAEKESHYQWGVSGTEVNPIWPQFSRAYPGAYGQSSSVPMLPAPQWPSDTRQFGVYYVRGPW